MDSTFGIRCRDFLIIAADTVVADGRSPLKLAQGYDKIIEVDGNKAIAAVGPLADCKNFTDFLKANIYLNGIRAGRPMSTPASANFARTELSLALRKGPYQCNLLVGGMSPDGSEAQMYWIDWLGTLLKVDKGAHGICAHLLYGLMDKYYREDMSLEEATKLIQMCINELSTRFLLTQREFLIKILTKDGITKHYMTATQERLTASTTGP